MIERRRYRDTQQPRASYALCAVRDRCELVRVGSLAHAYMLAMKFDELDVRDGAALMRPPPGWCDSTEPRA